MRTPGFMPRKSTTYVLIALIIQIQVRKGCIVALEWLGHHLDSYKPYMGIGRWWGVLLEWQNTSRWRWDCPETLLVCKWWWTDWHLRSDRSLLWLCLKMTLYTALRVGSRWMWTLRGGVMDHTCVNIWEGCQLLRAMGGVKERLRQNVQRRRRDGKAW